MLDVLEQAQGAGQKAQQDALIGQGSIFDLDVGAGDAVGPRRPRSPSHAPIPMIEFDRSSCSRPRRSRSDCSSPRTR